MGVRAEMEEIVAAARRCGQGETGGQAVLERGALGAEELTQFPPNNAIHSQTPRLAACSKNVRNGLELKSAHQNVNQQLVWKD
mmetsp:Transcript_42375/g.92158  ORF Transcript_42375/g.92158 Transcript_42375/m.92158 type:complete len:83 (+) Transcript_42375:17-265(+)